MERVGSSDGTLMHMNLRNSSPLGVEIIDSPKIEIIGAKSKQIEIPVEGEDSKPIVFNLKVKDKGVNRVKVMFSQQEIL